MLTPQTLKELQKKQNELDKLIHQQSAIEFEWITLWNAKRLKLALFTEVAEFANELKTFKIWRKKEKTDWLKAKTELIDCLCFFLGLCNVYQIDFSDFKNEHNEYEINKTHQEKADGNLLQLKESGKINQLILTFFSKTNNLPLIENEDWYKKERAVEVQKKDAYYSWLQTFNEIIQELKMDEAEVLEVYLDKFKINKERAKKGH